MMLVAWSNVAIDALIRTRSFSRGQSARSVANCQPLDLVIAHPVTMHTVDILLVASEVNGLDTTLLDELGSGLGSLGEGRPGGSVHSRDESPLLDGGSLGGLPQGAAEGSGCGAGGHFCCVCVERRCGRWRKGKVSLEVSNGRRGNNPDFSRPRKSRSRRHRLAVRDLHWLPPKPVTLVQLTAARQSSRPVIRADMPSC